MQNLILSNRFEPILFFWQFEWCALFLVGLFGATMQARNKRVLSENKAFSEHLEALVEQKQRDMARRVQGMSLLNAMEEAPTAPEAVSVHTMLREIYEAHHMAAEVAAVHLVLELPKRDGTLLARRAQIDTLSENLIFYVLHATPSGGKITIAAEIETVECPLSIADTGSGILPEDLPHIFECFFVGGESKRTGSGLGLYIVKQIVETQGGEITVSSEPGKAPFFYLDLPLV